MSLTCPSPSWTHSSSSWTRPSPCALAVLVVVAVRAPKRVQMGLLLLLQPWWRCCNQHEKFAMVSVDSLQLGLLVVVAGQLVVVEP